MWTAKFISQYLIKKDPTGRTFWQKLKNIKPISRIVADNLHSWRTWKEFPFAYWAYSAWLQDPVFDGNVADITPTIGYERYRDKRVTCLSKYVLDSKVFCSKLFHQFSIPHPPTVIYADTGRLFTDSDLLVTSDSQLSELISSVDATKIFLKYDSSYGGFGVIAFHRHGTKYVSKDGTVLDCSFLQRESTRKNFVCQQGLTQVSFLNAFNPDSLNTVRVLTRFRENSVEIVCAVLRMGRKGSDVDNNSSGGLVCGIDTDNWCLLRYGLFPYSHPVHLFAAHPDSGEEFADKALPFRQETEDLLKRSALLFPGCETIGWDIALTPDGPVVVEANWNPCVQLCQMAVRRGLAKELMF